MTIYNYDGDGRLSTVPGAVTNANQQQQKQNCLNEYNNSAAGKAIQFGSLYTAVTDLGSLNGILKTGKEWVALPALKIKVLSWINSASQAIGNTEFWSITSGAATPTAQVVAPTAAGISTAEAVGAVAAPVAILGATAADIQIHAACGGNAPTFSEQFGWF